MRRMFSQKQIENIAKTNGGTKLFKHTLVIIDTGAGDNNVVAISTKPDAFTTLDDLVESLHVYNPGGEQLYVNTIWGGLFSFDIADIGEDTAIVPSTMIEFAEIDSDEVEPL